MFEFRPAKRENVPLLIGLAGGTGSGKTYSAMLLAKGLSGGQRFAVIDTENGRARHYADTFEFDVADLAEPFRPDRYADATEAADKAGYPVIVVDSMSHEHAGHGGLLDWHEEEFQRMGGRDAVKMTAWIKPKLAHKAMVSRLLQVKAHVILCFRAEEKVEVIDDPDKPGKKKIVPKRTITGLDGWVPISEKNLPYELTLSFLLTADKPGVPRPIKLQEQHRAMVPLDAPIGEAAGSAFAAWAAGGETFVPAAEPFVRLASEAQRKRLFAIAKDNAVDELRLRAILANVTGQESTAAIPVELYDLVIAELEKPVASAVPVGVARVSMDDQLEMIEQELRDERRHLRSSQWAESQGRVADKALSLATLERRQQRIRHLESQAFELRDLLDAEGGE